MQKALWIFGFACGLALGAAAPAAHAQNAQTAAKPPATAETQDTAEKKQPSDRTVRVISSFAWSLLPEEFENSKGKKIKITKENAKSFLIPIDAARRVIRVGYLSAKAQMCDLGDHQLANYATMLKLEKKNNDWSDEQLLFINRLHLFTVLWLTGNVDLEDKNAEKRVKPKLDEQSKGTKPNPEYNCSKEEGEQVRHQIEAYVKANS